MTRKCPVAFKAASFAAIFALQCVERAEIGEQYRDAGANADAAGDAPSPTTVTLEPEDVALAASSLGACAVRADRTVRCWGENANGELGVGANETMVPFSAKPVAPKQLGRVRGVFSGSLGTCAIGEDDGAASCWGRVLFGRIAGVSGVEIVGSSSPLNSCCSGGPFVQIAVGYQFNCGLRADGQALCWGLGSEGVLGNNGETDTDVPVGVVQTEPFVQVRAAFGRFACGLTLGGGVMCWGSNAHREMGREGPNALTPTRIALGPGIAREISVGGRHACARFDDGHVACWGDNSEAQLGGDPVDGVAVVSDASGATQLAAGVQHTCALRADSSVTCWGSNELGAFPGVPGKTVPPRTMQEGSHGLARIACGTSFCCGIHASSGAVRCWGNDARGATGPAESFVP